MTQLGVESELACEVCGLPVTVRTLETPDGQPDFLTAVFPDGCWIGWIWPVETFGKLAVVAVCSHSCMVAWAGRNLTPTLLPPPAMPPKGMNS